MAKKPAKTKSRQPAKPPATKPKAAAPQRVADQIVNQTEMAEILGVTTRWLRQMATEEVVPTEGRGRFRVGAVVQAYSAFCKEGATKKTGTESLDKLRDEKALEIKLNRLRKDRELIAIDEAKGVIDEIVGMFVSSLAGLPAQITGVPRERHRLNDIFDTERQRLADRFAERRAALLAGRADLDPAAEDDAD